MRIIKLQIENIKRLVAVNISPDGNVIKISGKNGAGKTSILDSVWMALGGTKNVPNKPIRNGQTSASIKIDLGDLKVERKFNHKGTTLLVTDVNGTKVKQPQKVLDNLLGKLTFDPLAFLRLANKEQVNHLKDLIGLDFTEADLKRANVFERRTEAKRKLSDLTTQHDAIIIHPRTPTKVIVVSNLMESLKRANATNTQLERVVSRETEINYELIATVEQINQLQEKTKTLSAEMTTVLEYKNTHEKIDVTTIESDIENATELNNRFNHKQNKDQLGLRVEKGSSIVDGLTADIVEIDNDKKQALSNAKFPVDGLSFEDDVVTFNAIALAQASFAEQLNVSTAMAMALNPKLRIIRLTDGSMLDTSSMAQLEAIAEKHDFQVWVEVVDETGEVGIMIEDGMIANKVEENAA